jgi:PTS system nitrogen regulatory IIA component
MSISLSQILSADRIQCNATCSSKKAALEKLAALIASGSSELTPSEVFDSLFSRERLGSTGLGNGIALPHGRLKNGKQTLAAFIRLQSGIDYDAIDHKPVDLLFALLVPEESTEEHLQILSTLAELFSDTAFLNRLRTEDSPDAVFGLLTEKSDVRQ